MNISNSTIGLISFIIILLIMLRGLVEISKLGFVIEKNKRRKTNKSGLKKIMPQSMFVYSLLAKLGYGPKWYSIIIYLVIMLGAFGLLTENVSVWFAILLPFTFQMGNITNNIQEVLDNGGKLSTFFKSSKETIYC